MRSPTLLMSVLAPAFLLTLLGCDENEPRRRRLLLGRQPRCPASRWHPKRSPGAGRGRGPNASSRLERRRTAAPLGALEEA